LLNARHKKNRPPEFSGWLKAFFDCFEYQQTHTEYLR